MIQCYAFMLPYNFTSFPCMQESQIGIYSLLQSEEKSDVIIIIPFS